MWGCALQVEKLPGGSIEDCRVLKGVMFQKDVVAPGRMRRKIASPRIPAAGLPPGVQEGREPDQRGAQQRGGLVSPVWRTCTTQQHAPKPEGTAS